MLGKPREIRLAFTALLAGGHLLVEDLPGNGDGGRIIVRFRTRAFRNLPEGGRGRRRKEAAGGHPAEHEAASL